MLSFSRRAPLRLVPHARCLFSSEPPGETPVIDPCLYKTLGVEKDSNQKDIKAAYLQKARDFHPDKRPECLEYFTHVTKAYETLSNEHKRAVYDDEQISDEDFFSVKVAGVKVNMLSAMLAVSTVGISYFLYHRMAQKQKEGACPVDHKQRQEMIASRK